MGIESFFRQASLEHFLKWCELYDSIAGRRSLLVAPT
jgi:hypothetical protein